MTSAAANAANAGSAVGSAAVPVATAAPSIVVIDIAGENFLPGIERALAPYIGDEAGKAFIRISPKSFALSRSVYRRLRDAVGTPSSLTYIANQPGVARARLVNAPDVVAVMHDDMHELVPVVAPGATTGWNLRAVRAPQAWDMFQGGLAAAPWSQIRIGQLDTGYTPHPCFGFDAAGQLTADTWMRGDLGLNVFDGGGRPVDPMPKSGTPGHGTRIGSVICGYAGTTITGVAPRVTVVPYRVTDFVVIDSLWGRNQLQVALRHAMRESSCDVISISLGDPCRPNPEMGKAIDEAYMEGVLVCCAAGNITSEVTYPGRYRRTLTAGGLSSKNDKPWTGGSRGQRVDIAAPADEILRGIVLQRGGTSSFDYGDLDADGTSYATAHLSATAALWLAYHGSKLESLYGRTWRRVEAFRHVLRGSARKPAGWNDKDFGAGILDIPNLLGTPLPDPGSLRMIETLAENETV